MIIYVFNRSFPPKLESKTFLKILKTLKYLNLRKMARAGAGAGIFDKPEPYKNGPAPQHCFESRSRCPLISDPDRK
jgi:hypothetical protein